MYQMCPMCPMCPMYPMYPCSKNLPVKDLVGELVKTLADNEV